MLNELPNTICKIGLDVAQEISMSNSRRYAIFREKKQDIIQWLEDVITPDDTTQFMEAADFKQYTTEKWRIWEAWAGISVTVYEIDNAAIFELAWLGTGAVFLKYA